MTDDAPEIPLAGAARTCPACDSPRHAGLAVCDECGLIFPADPPDEPAPPVAGSGDPSPGGALLNGRYRAGPLIGERAGVLRFHGQDLGTPDATPTPVQILRERADPDRVICWPSLAWEKNLLERADHPALPRIVDHFREGGFEYLIESRPEGRSLRDAWGKSAAPFAHLVRVAEALRALCLAGAQFDGLRPESVVVGPDGVAIRDLSGLLPLPLTEGIRLRGTPLTPPELLRSPGEADGRAGLHVFGGLLHSLLLGRDLTDADFQHPGEPKPFAECFPDSSPELGRVLGRTFVRDAGRRFPSKSAPGEDVDGFDELIQVLKMWGPGSDRLAFEVAAVTSAGMTLTENHDAIAVGHECLAHGESATESAWVALADGRARDGFAARSAVAAMRESFTAPAKGDGEERVREALRAAGRVVREADRGTRCTAEAVWIRDRVATVAHVGDGRVYLSRNGELRRLTDDQTRGDRLIRLGQWTEAEAATHPRRAELEQSIDGRDDVGAQIVRLDLRPGDRLLVCSDGLTGALHEGRVAEILAGQASVTSVARHLVNAANLARSTDNVTVAIVFVIG